MELMRLPENKNDLSDALDGMRRGGWRDRNAFLVQCQLAHYYVNGFRKFMSTDVYSGNLMVGYENDIGELKFRNEDLRARYRTEFGRYMRMDFSPVVRKKNFGLDSLRKASMGQVALDANCQSIMGGPFKADFITQFLTFGMGCAGHWRTVAQGGFFESEIEVINPYELLPLPAKPISYSAMRGMMRYRMVPLNWIEDKKGNGLTLPATEEELMCKDVMFGRAPDNEVDGADDAMPSTSPWGSKNQSKNVTNKLSERFVPLTEAWIFGPRNTVRQYIVKVGKHIALSRTFDRPVPNPIGIARYVPTTGFYSYGFVSMLISLNNRVERLVQNLCRNVENLDLYGIMMFPTTSGVDVDDFLRREGVPRALQIETDYTVPEAKPFNVAPVNSGDFPGRVTAMIDARMDRISAQGPMMYGEAPGRMDSRPGAGMVHEISQIAVTAPATQIADAMSQVYRSVLASAKVDYQGLEHSLRITNLTDDIAGIKIGEGGEVSLEENPLPDYWEVDIDIKDRQPRSREQRIQELLLMKEQGEIDSVEFRLINYRENLDLPVGNRQEYEAYRKAIYNNIFMFNDGETPNTVDVNTVFDLPLIHLRAAKAFVSRLEFAFASKQVRMHFEQWINQLTLMIGQNWPQQLPGAENLQGMQPQPPMQMGGQRGL